MINWVFPIAGYGTRTSSLGRFKPFVEVYENCTILEICLSGLKELVKHDDKIIFITTKEHEKQNNVNLNISRLMKRMNINNDLDVIILDHTPEGQALTLKQGIEKLNKNVLSEKVIVINPDQMVYFDLAKIDMDNCSVGVYFNDSSSSCFYNLGSKFVTEIKEKQKISHYASSGVFYFTSFQKLLGCINWGIKNNKHYNGELYLGPCMEYLDKICFFKTLVKFDLGNVKNIELFKKFAKYLFLKGEIK